MHLWYLRQDKTVFSLTGQYRDVGLFCFHNAPYFRLVKRNTSKMPI